MSAPAGARRRTARQLLHEALDAQQGDVITLDTLLVPLRARAFGVLLLVLALPNFIPVPFGIGGIMGVLVIVLGGEMLAGLEHPLVPARLRCKTIRRARVENFLARTTKVMAWLERWCKPRATTIAGRPWSLLSGLALIILGFLLALPIPFTNYLFGVILLAFAFALIERDGVLLVVLWLLAAALLVLSLVFSNSLMHAMHQLWQALPFVQNLFHG